MNCGLLLGLILAGSLAGFTQNLVNNPSFEDHIRCPNNFSTQSKDFNLPGWNSVNLGTPDYFHQCSWGDCDVPFNWAGESNPHGGSAYVGIYVWNRPNSKPRSYREYVQGELKEPLKQGRRYIIEFYFKLASYSVYSVDRIGLLLTDSSFTRKDDLVINRTPTLSVIHHEPFTKNSWELAQMVYTAHGGEKFITIGNFFDNLTTQFTSLDNRRGKSPMLSGSAYLYLDDVSVSAIDTEPVPEVAPKPLLWTDGREIRPEETYILKNIQFEFDKYELLPVSFPELDRIVRILVEKPEWKAQLSGHTDDVGSEEYNLELSRNRATRVVDYLKSKGIAADRLGQRGYGKQQPLVDGKDDASRFINRRVEIRFLK